MIVNDRLYGRIKINSPVIIELIRSIPFQRLKKISQYGLPDEFYYQRLKKFTRFEHSVGVMILLKKLKASQEEQIAGLLHDVSHTAFSHLIDWVLYKDHHLEENFQDSQHKNFIKSPILSSILEKYGYSPESIFTYKKFTLLEQDLPEVCADRLDYALREFPRNISSYCIGKIAVENNKIVFSNKTAAYLFATNFLERQKNNWGSFEANARYKILSDTFRYALDRKLIEFKDFWQYDAYVINKLKKSKDSKILKTLSVLKNKSLKDFPLTNYYAKRKFRRVDPLFIKNNTLVRLSEVDIKFKNMLIKAELENKKGTKIPLI